MLQIKKSCSRLTCCTIFYEHLYMEEMLRVAQHDSRHHYSAYVTLTVMFRPGALMPQL